MASWCLGDMDSMDESGFLMLQYSGEEEREGKGERWRSVVRGEAEMRLRDFLWFGKKCIRSRTFGYYFHCVIPIPHAFYSAATVIYNWPIGLHSYTHKEDKMNMNINI